MKIYWRNLMSFRYYWTVMFVPIVAALLLAPIGLSVLAIVLLPLMAIAGLGTQMYCTYCRARVSMGIGGQDVCKKCGRATDQGIKKGVTP